jgi:hypothetical protein
LSEGASNSFGKYPRRDLTYGPTPAKLRLSNLRAEDSE